MLAGEGLHPSSKGVRVRFSGGKRTVIDGPFSETKELIAGFWLWQVRSKDEAHRVAQARLPFQDGEEVEIRQVFESGGLRRLSEQGPRASGARSGPRRADEAQAEQKKGKK